MGHDYTRYGSARGNRILRPLPSKWNPGRCATLGQRTPPTVANTPNKGEYASRGHIPNTGKMVRP